MQTFIAHNSFWSETVNVGDEAKLVYRKHGSGEQSPGEELQENNNHRMVDTGLSKPLWLNKEDLNY